MKSNMPKVEVTSPFWCQYRDRVRDHALPYQWDVITDSVKIDFSHDPAGNKMGEGKSGAVQNLRIAAGLDTGSFNGFPYQDSDAYKWLEAVAYVLAREEAPELRRHAEELVDLIGQAQMDDGYLCTYYQINGIEDRFTQIGQSHELYDMGHYIEAAIAYWQATGSEKALDIARRMADCVDANFGPEEGKIHVGDGHPEIEIALARLFEVTGEQRYLDLAHWLILSRGEDPEFYARQNEAAGDRVLFETMRHLKPSYYQIDKPYLEQTEVNGHAVRALYLLGAAAHVARLTDDAQLAATTETLWRDATRRRMYVTGQVGSTQNGEAFTCDFDLPNDSMYGETCASVAMSFVARRMLEADPRGEYGDVLERELFNGTISGMALDGRHFFYVNPLEADPRVSAGNPSFAHVLTRRAEWFPTPCCPANLARLVESLERYIYVERDGGATVLVNQFIASNATFDSGVSVVQEGNYPWDGDIDLKVSNPTDASVRVGVRIPGWAAGKVCISIDGAKVAAAPVDGFVYTEVATGSDAVISLTLPMEPRVVRASTRVRSCAGKVAVVRGPVVFCMESSDNDGDLWNYELDTASLEAEWCPEVLDGVVKVTGTGVRAVADDPDGEPYQEAGTVSWEPAKLTFVPYYAWANREEGQMCVWVRPTDSRLS